MAGGIRCRHDSSVPRVALLRMVTDSPGNTRRWDQPGRDRLFQSTSHPPQSFDSAFTLCEATETLVTAPKRAGPLGDGRASRTRIGHGTAGRTPRTKRSGNVGEANNYDPSTRHNQRSPSARNETGKQTTWEHESKQDCHADTTKWFGPSAQPTCGPSGVSRANNSLPELDEVTNQAVETQTLGRASKGNQRKSRSSASSLPVDVQSDAKRETAFLGMCTQNVIAKAEHDQVSNKSVAEASATPAPE